MMAVEPHQNRAGAGLGHPLDRLRRAPEMVEAGLAEDLREPRFARLRAEDELAALGDRVRAADGG